MGSFSSSKQKSSSQLPSWYSDYAKKALALGEAVSQQGYTPWMGADVAAFSPQQVQGMQGAQDFYSTFMTPGQAAPQVADSIPQAQEFAGGVKGYSSYPMFQEQVANLEKTYPGLANYMKQFTIDPMTGKLPEGSVWEQIARIGNSSEAAAPGMPGATAQQWLAATMFPRAHGLTAQQDFQNQQYGNWLNAGSPWNKGS
jgi:hypothetical protein